MTGSGGVTVQVLVWQTGGSGVFRYVAQPKLIYFTCCRCNDLKHNNVFFNFGHQHLGLTLAAISAELISSEVQDAKPQIDLTPYSIARFN